MSSRLPINLTLSLGQLLFDDLHSHCSITVTAIQSRI